MKRHGKSGNASDALGELSSKDRSRVKSFTPKLDALEVNLRRAIANNDIAESSSFVLI